MSRHQEVLPPATTITSTSTPYDTTVRYATCHCGMHLSMTRSMTRSKRLAPTQSPGDCVGAGTPRHKAKTKRYQMLSVLPAVLTTILCTSRTACGITPQVCFASPQDRQLQDAKLGYSLLRRLEHLELVAITEVAGVVIPLYIQSA